MRNLLILIFLCGVVCRIDAVPFEYSDSFGYGYSIVPDTTVVDEDILFFDENLPDTIIPLNEDVNYTREDSIIDKLKEKVNENTIYIDNDSIVDDSLQGDSIDVQINNFPDSTANKPIIIKTDSLKKDSVNNVMSVAAQRAEIERLAKIKADSIIKADTAMVDFTKFMKYNDLKKFMILPEEVTIPYELQAILDRPVVPDERYTSYDDTIIINPLFLPLTFDGKVLDSTINFVQKEYENKSTYRLENPIPEWLSDGLARDSMNKAVRLYAINYFPSTVKYDSRFAPKAPVIKQVDAAGSLQDYVSVQKNEIKIDPVSTKKVTVNYWVTKLTSNLSLSQGSYSSNYGRNRDYINLTSVQQFRLDYNPFSKVEFHLDATWNLNLASASGDTLRSITIGNDQFDLNTRLGLKAFIKGWSYTLSSSFRTRITDEYPANSKDKSRSFLSPGFFSLGVGLTYSYETKNKKFNTTITANPLSYQLNFVKDKNTIDPKRYGIPHGNVSQSFGATINASWGWQVFKPLRWEMWSQYNTNYEYVGLVYRNTFNLQLTRLLSARFYIDTEYNDSWRPDPRYKHTKIYETLSFGFNYTW